jgi:hypothetical protein
MKIESEVTKREKEVTDVICDRCGKPVKVSMGMLTSYETGIEREGFALEFADISVSWGYWSDGLDGLKTDTQLCQSCWAAARQALQQIGVKFVDTDYLNGGPWNGND